jgi:hypothetical protein
MAARKLRNYFKGHRIRVIMNQSLNDLFANKEASTRIIKWGAELSEYTVDFERISAIKSQVLADFVIDWTSPTHNPGEDMLTPWVVQCDGAWCHKWVGISAVVTSPTRIMIRYASRLIMQDFWLVGLFAKNLLSSESLLSHFSSCSSRSNHYYISNYCNHKCTNN